MSSAPQTDKYLTGDPTVDAARHAYTNAYFKYLKALEKLPHADKKCIALLDLSGAAYIRWIIALYQFHGDQFDPREVWQFPTTDIKASGPPVKGAPAGR